MSENKEIIYKEEFEENFEDIYEYINEDSEQNAKEFANDVKEKVEWIIKNPTAGNVENKIHSKQNWYRFKIVMKSWKIVYKVTKTLLVFLGIIHMRKHPDNIKKLRTNNYD